MRRDCARRAGRSGARRALRPDGRLPPLARRVPASSGRGVPPRLDPGLLLARHHPARSRGAGAPRAARVQNRAPLRPPLRRVRVARAGPGPGSGRGCRRALDAARGRSPPAAASAGAAHGGRAWRRQPARPVALGAAPGRGIGDRREGALEEAARRPRRGAAPAPGGADRRGGGDAGQGDREPARGPHVPPRLRAAPDRAARRPPTAGVLGRLAHAPARARHRGAPRAGRRARNARRDRADGPDRPDRSRRGAARPRPPAPRADRPAGAAALRRRLRRARRGGARPRLRRRLRPRPRREALPAEDRRGSDPPRRVPPRSRRPRARHAARPGRRGATRTPARRGRGPRARRPLVAARRHRAGTAAGAVVLRARGAARGVGTAARLR